MQKNIFLRHPHAAGETYYEHFCFASKSGLRLMWAGLACCIHSVLPFLFTQTASHTLHDITHKMNTRKNK